MKTKTLDYAQGADFEARVRADYAAQRILIVRQFPLHSREELLAFIGLFGVPQKEPYGSASDYFHTLRAEEQPLIDHKGDVITSSTNHVFGLHTDNYNKGPKAPTIGLLCVTPARVGGESHIARLSHVLEQLTPDTIAEMKRRAWPHPTGPIALLDTGGIRYNRSTIEAFAKALQTPLSARQIEVMDRVDEAAGAVKQALRLDRQEMLVLDNLTFLHGRSAFEPGSEREFVRWRINEAT
ncbi:MAG TPA: TauD/TfdA family dioxygenase [Alphaproteobacteria bacterium]|nr:TauD/TfdA family dioxygenase [Alphaproteobacteria bacterium]